MHTQRILADLQLCSLAAAASCCCLLQTYLRNEGVKSLSYNAAGRSQIAGGDSVQALEEELASSSRKHDAAGLVSIVVREREERPVKVRRQAGAAGMHARACVHGVLAHSLRQCATRQRRFRLSFLRATWQQQPGISPGAGAYSITTMLLCVPQQPQERLVAMGGKLVTLKEQAGEAPNGTSFMITTGPTPELDATNLIVGKVRRLLAVRTARVDRGYQ